jgi:cytochrome b561
MQLFLTPEAAMNCRYHPVLVALHWLLALMIIGGLIMGGAVLAETPNDDPFKLISLRMHMTMGILILTLMVVRLLVRVMTAKPPHADIGNAVLNKGGVATHWLFYVIVIGLCASGLAIANMAGLPAIVFGGSGDPLPDSFAEFPPRAAHGALASLLGLLILAHVAAGLYHQFGRKDGLFARMWFGDRDA